MSMSIHIPRAFVIGWPIAHSRSPLIHNYWLKTLELPGSYERVAVPPETLTEFLGNFANEGFVGGNVTIPHKESAFALCAEASQRARLLHAVNTLWIESGRLYGDNTDAAGFLASLDADAPGWEGRCEKVVVIGAGGAARSVVSAILSRSRCRIVLINRSLARGVELIGLMRANDPERAIDLVNFSALPSCLEGADLLVNTTSLGMTNQPSLSIDLAPLPGHAIVADIVYVPLETELLAAARRRGLKTSGGLGMLLHQAAPGFARWFGVMPEVTPELRALVARDIAGQS